MRTSLLITSDTSCWNGCGI